MTILLSDPTPCFERASPHHHYFHRVIGNQHRQYFRNPLCSLAAANPLRNSAYWITAALCIHLRRNPMSLFLLPGCIILSESIAGSMKYILYSFPLFASGSSLPSQHTSWLCPHLLQEDFKTGRNHLETSWRRYVSDSKGFCARTMSSPRNKRFVWRNPPIQCRAEWSLECAHSTKAYSSLHSRPCPIFPSYCRILQRKVSISIEILTGKISTSSWLGIGRKQSPPLAQIQTILSGSPQEELNEEQQVRPQKEGPALFRFEHLRLLGLRVSAAKPVPKATRVSFTHASSAAMKIRSVNNSSTVFQKRSEATNAWCR